MVNQFQESLHNARSVVAIDPKIDNDKTLKVMILTFCYYNVLSCIRELVREKIFGFNFLIANVIVGFDMQKTWIDILL